MNHQTGFGHVMLSAVPHLVVHLPAEVLELPPRVLQRVLLHVVGRRVRQQLVQSDDVPGDLAR